MLRHVVLVSDGLHGYRSYVFSVKIGPYKKTNSSPQYFCPLDCHRKQPKWLRDLCPWHPLGQGYDVWWAIFLFIYSFFQQIINEYLLRDSSLPGRTQCLSGLAFFSDRSGPVWMINGTVLLRRCQHWPSTGTSRVAQTGNTSCLSLYSPATFALSWKLTHYKWTGQEVFR